MIIIKRHPSTPDGTFGEMFMNGTHICYTLEPVESIIPNGIYKCIPHSGPHFSNVWEITGIKGHSAVLIHNGNVAADSRGCVLAGTSLGQIDHRQAVLGSMDALNKLRKILPKEFEIAFT